MYKLKYLLFILIGFVYTSTFSSEDCVSSIFERDIEYQQSNLVFLGEVIDYNKEENYFQFKILDIYKGIHPWHNINIKFEERGVTITPLNIEKSDGYWIIYSRRKGLNKATVNFCGASRNLHRRNLIEMIAPPPEFFKSKSDSLEYVILKKKLKIENQTEWINEVMLLKAKETNWSILILSGILSISIIWKIILHFKNNK